MTANGGTIEATATNDRTADGKTIYKVNINDEGMKALREEVRSLRQEIRADQKSGDAAPTQGTTMLADMGRVGWNATLNITEGTINSGSDALGTQNNSLYTLNPQRPQVDFSGGKLRYESEMMRRNLEGKIDGAGLKNGQIVETGVTIGAPLAVGGALGAAKTPETLESLGALPEVKISTPPKITKVKVGKLELPTTTKESVDNKFGHIFLIQNIHKADQRLSGSRKH